jgi:Alcohol dehydrogenase GroES-like domain
MQATVLYGERDIRFEDRPEPTIVEASDAIIRLPFTCICGSDLWPYRGIQPVSSPAPMGHEYCGVVEEIGRAVTSIKPGQFVIGSFFASDNTCPHCRHGYQTSCQRFEPVVGAQARGRHARRDSRRPGYRHDPKPPGPLRCDGHGLVCGGRREREAGCDRRRCGGRRRLTARCALGKANGSRAHHRHEPP